MLKYLIAIGLVVAIAIYVASEDKGAPQNGAQPTPKGPNPAISEETDTKQADNCANESKANSPRWYRLFAWPDGVTAWAILLTLIAIADQTRETARAARAGQSAADVALAQIRMEKATERARLNIKVERIQGIRMTNSKEGTTTWWLEAVLTLSNIGRGRAYFCNSGLRFIAMPFDVDPPSLEKELTFPLNAGVEYLDPSDSPMRFKCTLEDCPNELKLFLAKMESMKMTVYLCGFIEYETMGTKWHYPLGYFWTPVEDGIHPESWISDGHWTAHARLNGPEYEMPEKQGPRAN